MSKQVTASIEEVRRRAGKASKYRAQPTVVNGIRFDSKLEASKYQQLKLDEKVGNIKDLRLQVAYPFRVDGVTIFKYIADFEYQDEDGLHTVDVKGVRTPVYRLKKKLIEAQYGIKITEWPEKRQKGRRK